MIDLVGQVYGRMTVIKHLGCFKEIQRWLCRCECGVEKSCASGDLKKGHIRSCGCLSRELRKLKKHTVKIKKALPPRDLDQQKALALFEYVDGKLIRKTTTTWRSKVGTEAGTINLNGYWIVSVNRRMYPVHRVIFLMHHGHLPDLIDHADGNKLNNRIENLRVSNKSLNAANSSKPRKRYKTSSRFKGVFWEKRTSSWGAHVTVNRELHSFGYFKDEEEAARAYDKAAIQFFGEHARLNFPSEPGMHQ